MKARELAEARRILRALRIDRRVRQAEFRHIAAIGDGTQPALIAEIAPPEAMV
jgi:hypothetical protein